MPRKKRGPKPKAEVDKAKENIEQSSQSDKESSSNETPVKLDLDKLPFPIKRPRGRPSKKWQEQLALAIAEGRALPVVPKPKKKKDVTKGEKKEKASKKDKKENKTPKTTKTLKKDKKDIEESTVDKPDSPVPMDGVEKEAQPVKEPEVIPEKPQKSPTLIYLENLHTFLDKLYEYQWPQQPTGNYFVLEHQLCDFVGAASLYSKYNEEVDFHEVEEEEKEFLKENKIITEAQHSKALRAISTDDLPQFLLDHYPSKYQEYLQIAHKREKYTLLKKIEDEKIAKEAKKIPNPLKRALKDAVDFNSQLAQQRREERCSYFDMQTQIIHVPQNQNTKLPRHMTQPSNYPVALLPGQFQEFYKSYSSVLLRSFPIGTVLDSYLRGHQPTTSTCDSVIRGSLNDSESSASSSPSTSSSSSSDSEDSASTSSSHEPMSVDQENGLPEPPPKRKSQGYKPPCRPSALCGICLKGSESNKKGIEEDLIHCSQCENSGHPSCLDMSPQLVKVIITYPWQCMECKTCTQCRDPFDEDKMLFCDECDRGYHSFCVGLKQIPVGRWTCELCGVCASCLRRTPGEGPNSRWKSEYTKPRDKSEPQFLQTLCSPCSRLFRTGNFCPVCLKVYRNDESDLPMVCCDECDRWVHTDCDDIDDKSYAELSNEKTKYRCVLCRGEKEERMDSFARKNRTHETNQE